MSRRYEIRWEIDIEADTPEDAVRQALAIQRDPESIATEFKVYDGYGGFIGYVDPLDYNNKLATDSQWTDSQWTDEQVADQQASGAEPLVFNMIKPKD